MRQVCSRVSIHTGPQLKGSRLRYLSTVRVPRPFKGRLVFSHWAGCTSYVGAGGNVFGKQSKHGFAEFLIRGWGVDRGRVLFKGGEGNWLILILTEYILLDGYIRVFID